MPMHSTEKASAGIRRGTGCSLFTPIGSCDQAAGHLSLSDTTGSDLDAEWALECKSGDERDEEEENQPIHAESEE